MNPWHIEERIFILDRLRFMNFNRSHAASSLGISLRTLRKKIVEYRKQGIDIPFNSRAGKGPGYVVPYGGNGW